MRAALDALVRELGWPAVAELSPFARSRRFTNWQVRLDDGSHRLLRVAHAPAGHRGLEHEAAAHALLDDTELPRSSFYRLVDRERFGAPASISAWVTGQSGVGVLDAHPNTLADLCALCGQLASAVQDATPGGYGLTVVDGRFRPIRASWPEEYLAQVHDWVQRSEATGASLGPLGHHLLDRLSELVPALSGASRFCLLHGDLSPSNLILELGEPPSKDEPPPVNVLGLIDWEYAGRGDPLMAFGAAFELPDEGLAHFVDGWGAERLLAELAVPGAAERIEAYAIGRVFQYLALGVSAQIEGGGTIWGYGMAWALRLARERAEPGFAARRLEALLMAEALPKEVPVPDYVEPVPAALRRAIGRLTCRPVLGASAVGPWMAAVAAALRDVEHPDEGWVKDAHLTLDALGPEVELRGFEPMGPRGAWMAAMDDRVRVIAGEDGPALGLWWLAAEALVHLSGDLDPRNWVVQDGVFRGLQGFIESVAAEQEPPASPAEGLLRALIAVTADVRLEQLSGRPPDPALRAQRRARLIELWEDLVVFDGQVPRALSAEELTKRGVDQDRRDPSSWMVPVVLFAAEFAPDLPMPRDLLVGAICHRA